MPGLLDLPSELLFQIIYHVANSPVSLPPSVKRHRPEQLHSRNIVCVPTTRSAWLCPTRKLLLSSKRLNAETTTYHNRAPKKLLLDVAIVDNHWIWPSFRLAPANFGYALDTFHINLIYCCTEHDRGAYTLAEPEFAYEEDFVRMITNVLRSGPSGLTKTSMGSRSNYRVRTITVNIDSKNVDRSNELLSEDVVPYRQIDKFSHLSFDRLYSTDMLACSKHLGWLWIVLEKLLHDTPFALVILQRVDRIEFSVDSRVRRVIDIAELQARKEEKKLAEYKQRIQG